MPLVSATERAKRAEKTKGAAGPRLPRPVGAFLNLTKCGVHFKRTRDNGPPELEFFRAAKAQILGPQRNDPNFLCRRALSNFYSVSHFL